MICGENDVWLSYYERSQKCVKKTTFCQTFLISDFLVTNFWLRYLLRVTVDREIRLDMVRNLLGSVEVMGILFLEKSECLTGRHCKFVSSVAEARWNSSDGRLRWKHGEGKTLTMEGHTTDRLPWPYTRRRFSDVIDYALGCLSKAIERTPFRKRPFPKLFCDHCTQQ